MKMSEWIEPELHGDFIGQQIDALRLCTCPDGWVERFGVDVLISHKTDAALERLKTELCLWALNVDFKFRRVFARFLPRQNAEREAPSLILGDRATNLESIALERSLSYAIDFSAGYSVGLFIDQRENRRFIRDLAPGALLNCFAYTCSFSLAAATVGAKTVSIDLSKKSLSRGRENFALNSLPTTDHSFLTDDVMEVLPRLARRGEKFDAIILDPPTFSRSHRGKAFQVEQDFETLLLAALEVADRNARILLSTNCSTLRERALEVMARFCLKATRRAGEFHREPPLPDFPSGVAAATVWLTLR
ncbi:MAG TPA: class I SAM-dependent methyltransferase [Chthoniobacterales bacterium]|nr:class I SAM-dependent methyltransferase [Chthoniobacterales bacterium]